MAITWEPDDAPITPTQQQEAGPGVMQEWTEALDNPKVRASLLQFGLNLMTPQPGNTTAGRLAGGIGGAGELLSRQDESDRKDAEQARKDADTSMRDEARMG